jgi:hypothetical protein
MTLDVDSSVELHAYQLQCVSCGKPFMFEMFQQELFQARGWPAPKRCLACRKAARDRRRGASPRIAT